MRMNVAKILLSAMHGTLYTVRIFRRMYATYISLSPMRDFSFSIFLYGSIVQVSGRNWGKDSYENAQRV